MIWSQKLIKIIRANKEDRVYSKEEIASLKVLIGRYNEVTQVADMYCSMTGATLNESQREALERLLKSLFDTGFKAGKEDQESRVKTKVSIKKDRCDGCSTILLPLNPITLKHFNGDGMYCKYCIQINGEHDEESRTVQVQEDEGPTSG